MSKVELFPDIRKCLGFLVSVVCLVALLGPPSPAHALSAFVIWVVDGDTLTVIDEHYDLQRIRVYGIDCPESAQPYGFMARLETAWEVWGRPVTLQPVDRDRYGRLVARVQRQGRDLSAQLVRSGLAWVYTRYCRQPVCTRWNEMQSRARRAGQGLWSEPAPIPPWQWRRGQRPDSGWRWW